MSSIQNTGDAPSCTVVLYTNDMTLEILVYEMEILL